MAEWIDVSVAYAAPGIALCLPARLPAGATIDGAVRASGIAAMLPGVDLAGLKTGLWGKIKPGTTVLRDGDRVEIYRPLQADPNTARQHRVAKKRAAEKR